jgi:hypothetical protein
VDEVALEKEVEEDGLKMAQNDEIKVLVDDINDNER